MAFRMARWAEDNEFQNWLSSLTGDSPQQGRVADPATMQSVMPDIPVAGSGCEADPELPREVDAETEED